MLLKLFIAMPTRTLAHLTDRKENNFDLIRIFCAIFVIFGHIFNQVGGSIDPIGRALVVEYPGSIAVYIFFFLSGILVTGSYRRGGSALGFVVLRVARIWPGLAVCTLVIYLLVGPLFSSLPFWAFVNDWETQQCVKANLELVHGMCIGHSKMFASARIQHGVDYPLWTLPMESACYVLVLILGVFGVLRRAALCAAACVIVFVAFMAVTRSPPEGFLNQWFIIMGGYSFYPIPLFLLGMVCYAFRDRIYVDWRVGIALLAAFALFKHHAAALPFLYLGIAMMTLVIGSSKWLKRHFPLKNDYSYGVYIYGFFVGQCISSVFPTINVYFAFLMNAVGATMIAALSWHLVEKPCLRLGRRVSKRSKIIYPLPDPAT
jgi:peptidoglycan/LPS O-acetylase OafA/YrhL